jgi:DNA-binding GntR family transcriptional regulator
MSPLIIQNQPLHEQVAQRLRRMIVSGDLAPGSDLLERELTESFGVSRTPLREALKILAHEKLVELLPRRGARVSVPSPDSMRQTAGLLGVIQGHAAALVCRSLSPADIEQLTAINERILAFHGDQHPVAYVEANLDFHLAIADLTRYQTLIDVHHTVFTHLRRSQIRAVHGKQPPDMQKRFFEEHLEIIRMLTESTPEQAERYMRRHFTEVGGEMDLLAARMDGGG